MTEKKDSRINLNKFSLAHRWVAELLLTFGKSIPSQSPEALEASRKKLLEKLKESQNKPQ